MAPKKEKDVSAQLASVLALPHHEQVDLLSQALLREYMHRRQYHETLKAFDAENPRDERTISSRALMTELMCISSEQASRLKTESIETIMEILCSLRVEKATSIEQRWRTLHEIANHPMPEVPKSYFVQLQELEDEIAKTRNRIKKLKKAKAGALSGDGRRSGASGATADVAKSNDTKTKKSGKKKASTEIIEGHAMLSIDELLEQDDTAKIQKIREAKEQKRREVAKTMEAALDDDATAAAAPQSAAGQVSQPRQVPTAAASTSDGVETHKESHRRRPAVEETPPRGSGSSSSSASNSGGDSSDDDGGPDDEEELDGGYAASLKKIREEEERALQSRRTASASKHAAAWSAASAGAGESVRDGSTEPLHSSAVASPPRASLFDDSVTAAEQDGGSPHPWGHIGANAHPSPEKSLGSSLSSSTLPALGVSVAEEVKVALVGLDRKIPNSFWQQGFYFSKDVEYGLLQNEGGCCGVLAVVQALIVNDVFGQHRLLTDDVKRSALCAALLHCLIASSDSSSAEHTGVQGGNVRHVRICFAPLHSAAHQSMLAARTMKDQVSAMARLSVATGFSSASVLEEFVAEHVLRSWTEAKGVGLLCFMISVLLTRGVRRIRDDMDVEGPLIVEHGYCSQELVNLLLVGKATSNVHEGNIQHGELLLKGIPAELCFAGGMPIGFLSYMDHRQLLQVGNCCKHPKNPVWVVNHESHYTVLFMKDDKRDEIEAGAKSSFAEPYVFDVFFWDQLGGQDAEIRLTVTLERTPVPPVASNVIIPYLNDVIRTVPEWKTARVGWNGTDPLL